MWTPAALLAVTVHCDIPIHKHEGLVQAPQLSCSGLTAPIRHVVFCPAPSRASKTSLNKRNQTLKEGFEDLPASSKCKHRAYIYLVRSDPISCCSASQQTEAAICWAPLNAARSALLWSITQLISGEQRLKISIDFGEHEASRTHFPRASGNHSKVGVCMARGIYTKAWVMGSRSFTPESLPLLGDTQPLQLSPGSAPWVPALCPRIFPLPTPAFSKPCSLARQLFYMGERGRKPKPARNRLAGNYILQHLLLATICFIISILKIGIHWFFLLSGTAELPWKNVMSSCSTVAAEQAQQETLRHVGTMSKTAPKRRQPGS